MTGRSGAPAGVAARPAARRIGLLERIRYTIDRTWSFIVLFAIARLIVGFVIIWFDGGFAWGMELTLIVAVAAVVYMGVALAVRRWSPPRSPRPTR